jgi:hypothetical protein
MRVCFKHRGMTASAIKHIEACARISEAGLVCVCDGRVMIHVSDPDGFAVKTFVLQTLPIASVRQRDSVVFDLKRGHTRCGECNTPSADDGVLFSHKVHLPDLAGRMNAVWKRSGCGVVWLVESCHQLVVAEDSEASQASATAKRKRKAGDDVQEVLPEDDDEGDDAVRMSSAGRKRKKPSDDESGSDGEGSAHDGDMDGSDSVALLVKRGVPSVGEVEDAESMIRVFYRATAERFKEYSVRRFGNGRFMEWVISVSDLQRLLAEHAISGGVGGGQFSFVAGEGGEIEMCMAAVSGLLLTTRIDTLSGANITVSATVPFRVYVLINRLRSLVHIPETKITVCVSPAGVMVSTDTKLALGTSAASTCGVVFAHQTDDFDSYV